MLGNTGECRGSCTNAETSATTMDDSNWQATRRSNQQAPKQQQTTLEDWLHTTKVNESTSAQEDMQPPEVFCDNYLDGGYHVPFAHGGLASNLNLQSYSTELFEKVSVQSCETKEMDDNGRLGEAAVYAFVYPNFMINRYGPWMDTNLVLPTATNECQVIFDYFLDVSFKNDNMFIEQSLQDSEVVQVEDISLCEGVQMGLESPAFNRGRYAPRVEMAMHHFHSLLQRDLSQKYNYNS
eukprot:c25721_g1_i1 orf=514-1227(+)